jgi:hypothetical protein
MKVKYKEKLKTNMSLQTAQAGWILMIWNLCFIQHIIMFLTYKYAHFTDELINNGAQSYAEAHFGDFSSAARITINCIVFGSAGQENQVPSHALTTDSSNALMIHCSPFILWCNNTWFNSNIISNSY